MARLAEASVVIALRDWQWMHRRAHDQFPDRYLALSGNAEKKMGDAAIRHDERLFLFELKSTDTCIEDEWKIQTLADGTTRERKSAHRWATALADRLISDQPDELSNKLFIQSLQAHHFVYWSPYLLPNVPTHGHLVFQPYFFGTFKKRNDMTWVRVKRRMSGTFDLATVRPPQVGDASGAIRYAVEKVLPLDAIHRRSGRLMELTDPSSSTRAWRYLGLPFADFQHYVNELCGGLKQAEPINVVLLSDGGSFFAHLTSTDQLKTVFDVHIPNDVIQHEIQDQYPSAFPTTSPRFQ